MAAADRSRWLSTVGSAGLGAFFALLVAMLVTNWVVVDVRSSDDGERVRVPLPINLLRIPLHMAPRATVRVPMTCEAERQHARALAALHALREAPEGATVPLDVRHGAIALSRRGDTLVVVVGDEGCGESVRATLPFAATLRLLEQSADGRVEPRALLDVLAAARRGELLAVEADDARVRVTTW